MESRDVSETEGAVEASRGSSVSLEMTPPPIHDNLLLGPAGMEGVDKEDGVMNVLSSPPSGSLCDLGQVTHYLWPGRPAGDAEGRQPSGDKPPGGCINVPHIWGWAAGGPGGCVAKETSHHPSRGLGSVLNCLLQEAELSSKGGQRGGQRIQLLLPHPNLCPGRWTLWGTGLQGQGGRGQTRAILWGP